MDRLVRAAIALILAVIILAGVMTFYSERTYTPVQTTQQPQSGSQQAKSKSPRELIIYTYSGFMAWGSNPKKVYDEVFNEFGREYNVTVKVVKFDSARQALLAAINEYKRGQRTADLVIGVDNLLVYEARQAGIIQCYYSPIANASVPKAIADALDPNRCVTPFDYSVIAIVYDPSRLPANITSILSHPTLEDLARPEIAKRLVLEDPTKSSTGLAFLFWEIGLSEKLMGTSWTVWWKTVKPYILVEPSWGKAYDVFSSNSTNRPIIVSYGTDPAYSAWSSKDGKPSINATLIYSGNKSTAWLQVEGLLVVKGQPGTKLAEEFVDWMLSRRVQELIPDNQWMLPARSDVALPPYYKYALTLDNVNIVVNNLFTSSEIESGYQNWLLEWTQIMGGK